MAFDIGPRGIIRAKVCYTMMKVDIVVLLKAYVILEKKRYDLINVTSWKKHGKLVSHGMWQACPHRDVAAGSHKNSAPSISDYGRVYYETLTRCFLSSLVAKFNCIRLTAATPTITAFPQRHFGHVLYNLNIVLSFGLSSYVRPKIINMLNLALWVIW